MTTLTQFVEVYARSEEHGTWDAVVTCYFMDTARNVLRYLEVINALLPIGGVWANAGPLLWHFEHDRDGSIELSLDEMLAVIEPMGFVMEERRTLAPQTYTGSARSMLRHWYEPEMWVCKKVKDCSMAPPL